MKNKVLFEEGMGYNEMFFDEMFTIGDSAEFEDLALVEGENKDHTGAIFNMKSRFFVAAIWEKEQENDGHDN